MNFVVPSPVPLDLPPGNVGALEELVQDVEGAAFWLSVLSTALAGPAASAPGWLGCDASAAAAEVAAVAGIARECSAAVGAAAHRLRLHHDLLRDAVRQVAALEAEQQENFSEVWSRLSCIQDIQAAELIADPRGVAAIEDLRAAEAVRRRRHAALMVEVADDAAATARVLRDSCAVVGGRGARGDAGRVLAYLAGELPGWGDAELHRRGSDLARALSHGSWTPEEMESLARDAVDYAGAPEFARGLLSGLGVDGVRGLLRALGYNTLGGSSDVATVLAAAFGAAVPNGRAGDPVRKVLTATYVAPDDRYGDSDVAAAGLAAVLLAGLTPGAGAVRPETAAQWARQLLLRERAQGVVAGGGAVPADWDPRALDPAGLAIAVVAAGGETASAAELLADRAVWDAVLARFWGDGGEAMSAVVALAGAELGPAGADAVRSGLEALGAGLSEKGDPAHWTVNKASAAAVARSLGEGVATHVSVATDVLWGAVEGRLGGVSDDVLRGLGYLTVDRPAAAAVESALNEWVRAQRLTVQGNDPGLPAAALAVSGAYFAVQDYGQRLAHAIRGFEAQDAAEATETVWNWTFGLIPELLRGPWGVAAGVVEGYGAIFAGADGTWDDATDRGLRFGREVAASEVVAQLSPVHVAGAREMAAQLYVGYDRTAAVLGTPRPPMSPEPDYYEPLLDALGDVGLGRVEDLAKKGLTVVRAGP